MKLSHSISFVFLFVEFICLEKCYFFRYDHAVRW